MDLPGEFADRRSEAGETLIEVLLASALMALVVLGIIGGIVTMVLGSAVHRDQSESNAGLISAMEQLKSPAEDRLCPVGAELKPAYTPLANVSWTIEYQVADNTGMAFGWSATASHCDDNHPATTTPPAPALLDQGTPDRTNPLTLQRITLKYTHPDSTNVEPALTFIKGDY